MRRIVPVVAQALAVYGFAAWVYIAAVALVHPHTLGIQLTHLASWPREDTFGELSFVVSFVAFIVYRSLRQANAVVVCDAPDQSSSRVAVGCDKRTGGQDVHEA